MAMGVDCPACGQVARTLVGLTERERLVLRLRFALDDSYHHTLREIGEGLGITPDEVRRIEAGALHKLHDAAPPAPPAT